jgi:hypothetical protein
MPDGLTRVAQETEVGEGLAVGCLVGGVSALGSDDGALEAAFTPVWAAWPWAARYPSLGRSRLAEVLRKSARRRGQRVAQWVTSAGLHVPQLRDDEWDLTAACARLEESSLIPARRWCELAAGFVAGLDEQLVWRFPPVEAADVDQLPSSPDLG